MIKLNGFSRWVVPARARKQVTIYWYFDELFE